MQAMGTQKVYGNGTGRPDGGWSEKIAPQAVPAPETADIGEHTASATVLGEDSADLAAPPLPGRSRAAKVPRR